MSVLANWSRFIKDLETGTSQPLGMAIRDLTTALGSFGLAFYESWKLTLVIVASIPIIAVLVPIISSRVQPNIDRQTAHLSDAAKHVTNAFSIIETVKCYNGQRQERSRYSTLLKNAARYYHRQVFWHALQASVLRFITLTMFVQGFWYGSTLITKDAKSAGTIFTSFFCCLVATSSLMQIMPQLMCFEKGNFAGHQLRAVIFAAKRTPEKHPRKLQSHAADIVFRDVSNFRSLLLSRLSH
jgi:ATP-binding cassette, subfamily B (MDR/TAP), member 1